MYFESHTRTNEEDVIKAANIEAEHYDEDRNAYHSSPKSSILSAKSVGDNTTEELVECWDHSKEQYELIDDFYYNDNDLVFHSTRQTSSPEPSILEPPSTPVWTRLLGTPSSPSLDQRLSLTSLDSDEEVFPRILHGPTTRSSLKRQAAIRRRNDYSSPCNNLANKEHEEKKATFPQPSSPHNVNTTLKQDLSRVLKSSRPLVPEAVVPHQNRAVVLDSALDNLPFSLDDVPPTDSALPYLRPRRLTTYRTFYNSKRSRGKERR